MIERGNFAEALSFMGFTQAGNVYFFEGDAWRMTADCDSGMLIYPEVVSLLRPQKERRYE